jgi:hypothetical protein
LVQLPSFVELVIERSFGRVLWLDIELLCSQNPLYKFERKSHQYSLSHPKETLSPIMFKKREFSTIHHYHLEYKYKLLKTTHTSLSSLDFSVKEYSIKGLYAAPTRILD